MMPRLSSRQAAPSSTPHRIWVCMSMPSGKRLDVAYRGVKRLPNMIAAEKSKKQGRRPWVYVWPAPYLFCFLLVCCGSLVP